MIEVRRAGPGDGDVLGEIHAASWAAAYASFFDAAFAEEGVRDRRTRWHGRIADGAGTILVAALDDRPLAFSYVIRSPTRPGLAEIFSFYSHPDAWGRGLAVPLMDETLRVLRADGFGRVHLWTLRDTPRSRGFYRKSGFTETGAVRTHDFGDGNPLEQVEYQRDC
ncbi:MAG TPA: GNAT family N-acetyltransferase [Pseudonocardiaceae bacterium]|nr:GNAT family N-acetyltransferase [Pseudonocardiaceae bacterium]